ncbi:ATP-binding protein [Pseudodesulfovibrio sp. zrk46]|uniref:ATP-binding protein n=1 Tax=Pseudodesulfovibrio sp. zrk46 TaxID=2725288 RepID=UPI001FFD0090|nr:ATP-binding protein [Pseudodesulfovibrio sp. zrk46]
MDRTCPKTEHVIVENSADVHWAVSKVKKIAREIGFDATEQEELVVCAKELAMNMVLHAEGGILSIRVKCELMDWEIEFTAKDNGPGLRSIDEAIADGLSSRGGLGIGLGTLNRFMDSLDLLPVPEGQSGTRIRCTRKLKKRERYAVSGPLDVGVASRPCPGFNLNGDSYVVRIIDNRLMVCVIDGLGHGQFAHKAASAAQKYVEDHVHLEIEALFKGVDRSCRATRGVVMALALIDWERNSISLAGVGNIEVRYRGSNPGFSYVFKRGFLGAGVGRVSISEHVWEANDLLIMHSDGISSKWSLEDDPTISLLSAKQMALALLRNYGRDNDDATILIVKKADGADTTKR